jgi:methane/ammonia monooxygenase subunit C
VWSPVPLLAMVGSMLAVVAVWWWYQQVEGFASGLDASTPEFARKWMPLWYLNVTLAAIGQLSIPLVLWLTRDRNLAQISPREELRRYLVLFATLIAMTFTQFVSITFGTIDAAWHQVVVRDTSLTPSHIVLFFGIVPLFTCFGLGAFFYSFTRIPQFAQRLSVAMLLAVTAPFLVLPSVAYNEWGHAYWLMEELFIAPLHWGFVALGWAFVALFGALVQSLPRVLELTRLAAAPAR